MTKRSIHFHHWGDDIVEISFEENEVMDKVSAARALANTLRATGEWQEVIAGMSVVTIKYDNLTRSCDEAEKLLIEQSGGSHLSQALSASEIVIPICYDAEFAYDLEDLARRLKMESGEILKRHLTQTYTIDMIGFLPGFAYCGTLDPALVLPRKAQPRARVAAGSIGIAGHQTGIYSLDCPGGWSIIGRTPLKLFKPESEFPFLLEAGARLKFQQITRDQFDTILKEQGA